MVAAVKAADWVHAGILLVYVVIAGVKTAGASADARLISTTIGMCLVIWFLENRRALP